MGKGSFINFTAKTDYCALENEVPLPNVWNGDHSL